MGLKFAAGYSPALKTELTCPV